MITDRVHEKIGTWLLKQEDEARAFSYRRHVLESAYEMFILKKMRYEIMISAAICLIIFVLFNDELIRWTAFILFFTVNFCSAMILAKTSLADGEEYCQSYVDKKLGKGQYNKIIHTLHLRQFDKDFKKKFKLQKHSRK